jgi:hypothetical protein
MVAQNVRFGLVYGCFPSSVLPSEVIFRCWSFGAFFRFIDSCGRGPWCWQKHSFTTGLSLVSVSFIVYLCSRE